MYISLQMPLESIDTSEYVPGLRKRSAFCSIAWFILSMVPIISGRTLNASFFPKETDGFPSSKVLTISDQKLKETITISNSSVTVIIEGSGFVSFDFEKVIPT